MIRIILITVILFYYGGLFGQKTDSVSTKHFPKHYFSINPINSIALDQPGINYEYKQGILGIGLTAGYKYAGKRNYSRFFISGTTEYGSFEFYKGFFLIPQVNLYLSKPKNIDKATICYLNLRCIYKYMHIDSTNWVNFGGTGDRPLYRKQIDNVNLVAPYFLFGVKYISKHFFIDFNLGPGWVFIRQSMIVAGDAEYHPDIWDNTPVHNEFRSRNHFSFTLNLNFGGAF